MVRRNGKRSSEHTPMWLLMPRIMEVGLVSIVLTASLVIFYTVAYTGSGWQAYMPPSVLLLGVTLSYRFPWAGLVVIAIAPVLTLLSDTAAVGTWSMVCFSAFLLTLRGLTPIAVAPILALSVFVPSALSIGTIDISIDASSSIFAFSVIVCAVFGAAARGNARYRQEVQLRIHEEQTARRAAVDRGIAQERLRIARDLHDSVGHQVAMINMHLGAAEVSLHSDEESVRSSLEAARGSVREVLKETQQILAILNTGRDENELGATPGHELISNLIESYRTGGMHIDATIHNLGDGIAPQVSIAAYRIVQEGLTNAHRYGDGMASIAVERDIETEQLKIEIVNRHGSRKHPSEPGGGNGLVGMRERAESVGGSMEIQSEFPLFWVVASLPVTGGQ
ncbi:MAG: histidine kinase [Bifidobacterium sp.]|nr:histidine kinase [Bifidobacterium sp.]MCH4175431.1 histidine kinase [Bifidobacterium sp.]